jgi:protoporphyrinogen oxidase
MQFGEEIMSRADVTVVGGGLAGLTAAAVVARAGRSVLVLEQASDLGGRAVTQVRDGVHWNLGAHAIYCRGHAFRLLRELGVPFTGRYPSPGRALVVRADGSYRLPAGFGTLLGSMMLSAREKWRLVRFAEGRRCVGAPLARANRRHGQPGVVPRRTLSGQYVRG